MAMARVTPDNCVAFPDLCFPGPFACEICPGLYLDTPQWIPYATQLEVIAACFPSDRPVRISFSDVDVDVRIDDQGELYGGLIIKTIRTDDWLLCKVHARITFYHPWIAPLETDPFTASTDRPDRKSFRIQPSRVPYLRPQLLELSAQITEVVNKARRDGLWVLQARRNPFFDGPSDSKRVRTVAFELTMSEGLAPLIWKMKSMVEAVAKQGKTPSWDFHLRAWGCEAVGRAPSGTIGTGFWGTNRPWPLPLGVNPWGASAQAIAAGATSDDPMNV